MRRRPLPLLLLAAGLVACSSRSYDVLVHLPEGQPDACRVEVSILESCADLEQPADAPEDPVRTVTVTEQRAPAFGELLAGNYGLHARAFDCDCTLLAAGCARVYIEGGEGGRLEVTLEALEPRGCDRGEVCTDGVCVGGPDAGALDAGPDAEADSSADAEADGAPDAAASDAGPDGSDG